MATFFADTYAIVELLKGSKKMVKNPATFLTPRF
jgi:hypothetical protein